MLQYLILVYYEPGQEFYSGPHKVVPTGPEHVTIVALQCHLSSSAYIKTMFFPLMAMMP